MFVEVVSSRVVFFVLVCYDGKGAYKLRASAQIFLGFVYTWLILF